MDHAFIEKTLGEILELINLSFEKIVVSDDKETGVTRVDVDSNEASRLIGWHGETLNSLQHLIKAMVRTKEGLERSPFIVLDVDGYRKIQEEKVCKAADQKADFVRRTGSRVALPPMSPYFRRIVHLYVANNKDLADLKTESAGEGEYRQIILMLKDESSVSTSDEGELSPVMSEEDDGLGNLDV